MLLSPGHEKLPLVLNFETLSSLRVTLSSKGFAEILCPVLLIICPAFERQQSVLTLHECVSFPTFPDTRALSTHPEPAGHPQRTGRPRATLTLVPGGRVSALKGGGFWKLYNLGQKRALERSKHSVYVLPWGVAVQVGPRGFHVCPQRGVSGSGQSGRREGRPGPRVELDRV